MAAKKKNKGLVYSTDMSRMCPGCGCPPAQCSCSEKSPNKGDGILRISRETKGRKGGGVCLIRGLSLDKEALRQLAKQLKQKCGTGGAIKEGVIEIQGDHRQLLQEELQKLGYKVKLAGG